MQKISLEELKAGSVVERHLYFHEKFIVFSKYLVLSGEDLERAKRFNLNTLAFDEREPRAEPAAGTPEGEAGPDFEFGERLEPEGATAAPALPSGSAEKRTAPAASRPLPRGAEKTRAHGGEVTIYGSIVNLLSKEFMKARLGERIEAAKIIKIASIIVEYVTNVREEAILHVARGSEKSRVESHSANVGILAAVLGMPLKMKGADLANIVTGAILHDIGILLIQDEVSSADGGDADRVKDHTWQGFRYLKSIRNLDPDSVMPALQHHEKAGGDGYPQKLTLHETEPSSRLVSLCDSFDNQISFLKYGNDLSIHFTKNEFVGWKKEDFDPQMFTASIRIMGEIFKPRTPVILNDGSLALVKEVSIRFPFSPVVQVVADDKGNKTADSRTVDTRKGREVWIAKFVKRTP